MSTVVDELIVRLGLDTKDYDARASKADKQLKSLAKTGKEASGGFKDAARSLGTFLAALGGAYAIKVFVESTIEANGALERLSKNLGISVESISAWGQAVEQLGGSAKGLQGTMTMLSQEQTKLRLTGESSLIPYFAALGVAMSNAAGQVRPVDQILLDLSEKLSKLDRPTANNLGHMIGLDQDTLNLLLQGRQAVELTIKRQKEQSVVSKAQAEEAAKLQKSIAMLRQEFVAMGRNLLEQAYPAIERMLSALSSLANWVRNNAEFVKDLGAVLAVVATGLTAIEIAASPLTLTVAAVIALAGALTLLWQDYQTWKRGGDALIDWEKWKPGIDAAKAAIRELTGFLKEMFQVAGGGIGSIGKLLGGDWHGALGSLHSAGHHGVNAGVDLARGMVDIGKGLIAQATNSGPGRGVSDAYAMKYFQDRGFSRDQAAGLASQIHSESSGNSDAIGDHGSAYGLLQWHADRQAAFKRFSGHDIHQSNADEQLAFVVHELMTSERSAGDKIRGASSAQQAGEYASRYYVRPADQLGEMTRRGQYARGLAGNHDNSVTVQTGPVTVVTQATDADGISRDFAKSFNYAFTAQANSGLF